jgi:predicted dehydrogenase
LGKCTLQSEFLIVVRFRRAVLLLLLLMSTVSRAQQQPFRIGIAGLSHTHVHWLLGRAKDGDLQITGIAEANRDLAERYLKQYGLPTTLLYPTLRDMLEKSKPEAVLAFNPIDEHLAVVRECAPRKIHVMVEKPLAASLDQAKEMVHLARQHGIHLLTNYETTWYASNYEAQEKLEALGPIHKLVAHHGHPGPKAIGVNDEFLAWLTDPVKNGGGALTDLMTKPPSWLRTPTRKASSRHPGTGPSIGKILKCTRKRATSSPTGTG